MPRSALPVILLLTLLAFPAACSSDRAPSFDPGPDPLHETMKLLGNNAVQAIAYSGHRKTVRNVENTPTVEETKEDLRILAAMDIKLLRTYNTTIEPHTERTLQAIRELKRDDPDFEMYVMLGAWIQCQNAYLEGVDHSVEDAEFNRREIEAAIRLANEYPDVVRIIAVGNEAMVTWQGHFVPAGVILDWVKHLQEARGRGEIPAGTLITTSENWAALGGEESYRNADLAELVRRIDFLSLHTYAFHDTYYNPALQWASPPGEADLPVTDRIEKAIERCVRHQKDQHRAVQDYLASIGVDKRIHIGETGWASLDNSHYGDEGTRAADEYIAGRFYSAVRTWARESHLTCFYFEAFDEPWKSDGTAGSEGHFGLFTVEGQAKYALWHLVDKGNFAGLSRGGHPVRKTHDGVEATLLEDLKPPVLLKFRP